MALHVVAFTLRVQRIKFKKTLFITSNPALLKPHTSLPYVRIGRIKVSNMSKNILGGKDLMNFNFRFITDKIQSNKRVDT